MDARAELGAELEAEAIRFRKDGEGGGEGGGPEKVGIGGDTQGVVEVVKVEAVAGLVRHRP